MIIRILLLAIVIVTLYGIFYMAYKLYKSAIIDDELRAQQDLLDAEVRIQKRKPAATSVKNAQNSIDDFLSTRAGKKFPSPK